MHVITQNSNITIYVDLFSAYQHTAKAEDDIYKTTIKFVSRTDGRGFFLGSHYLNDGVLTKRWTKGDRFFTYNTGGAVTGLFSDSGLGYFDIEFYASTVDTRDSTTDDFTRVLNASTLHPVTPAARDRVLRQRAYFKAATTPEQFINKPTGTDIEPDIDVPTIVYT